MVLTANSGPIFRYFEAVIFIKKVKLQFFWTVERPIKKATLYCFWGGVGRVKPGFFILGAELMNPDLFWP